MAVHPERLRRPNRLQWNCLVYGHIRALSDRRLRNYMRVDTGRALCHWT